MLLNNKKRNEFYKISPKPLIYRILETVLKNQKLTFASKCMQLAAPMLMFNNNSNFRFEIGSVMGLQMTYRGEMGQFLDLFRNLKNLLKTPPSVQTSPDLTL